MGANFRRQKQRVWIFGFLDSETPELSIAIKEKSRGQGIGTKLIGKIAHFYKEKGIKSISLSIDKKNLAFELYKKIGFAIVIDSEKSVVMRLDLKDFQW